MSRSKKMKEILNEKYNIPVWIDFEKESIINLYSFANLKMFNFIIL